MPAYIDQSLEEFSHRIYIGNLPVDVSAKEIREIFGRFGVISRFYFKRRISSVFLLNPFAILTFEQCETIDQIMSTRPHFIKTNELFLRRCLPLTRRYPYESYVTTTKMLVRIPHEHHHEILPKDVRINQYFKTCSGSILRLERLGERTVLIEFDDYDSVDVCCLLRPHWINHQLIEVEKCMDEQQARSRARVQEKTHSNLLKLSPKSPAKSLSSTNTILDEKLAQLQLIYNDRTDHLEDEHKRLISSLKIELEHIMKERIRLQRLILDYQDDQHRLLEENQRLKKLSSENLEEHSRIQYALLQTTNRYHKLFQTI